MKSEIRFATPNIKLTFTIGLLVTILIIFLSYRYHWQVGLILLVIGGSLALAVFSLAVGVTGRVVYRLRVWSIDVAKQRQELRILTFEADKKQMESFVLSFPKTQRIVTLPEKNIRVIEALAEPAQMAMLPASAGPQVNLLDVVSKEQRVLIKGVSNAGKTNLLQWIASRKQATSKVLVIDPHSSPDKWAGCQVVGTGSNHPEIEIALDRLIALMVKRYQDIAAGKVQEGQHSRLTILIDEWMSIAYQCANAKEAIVRLLTESRKAAFSIYIGSHSERVASLGLDGKGDLRDGFCLVRLYLANGERSATIDYGNGEQAALLPGPFSAGPVMESSEFINLDIEPTPTEAAILTLHRQGENHKIICEAIGWTPGGKQYQRIDEILTRFAQTTGN